MIRTHMDYAAIQKQFEQRYGRDCVECDGNTLLLKLNKSPIPTLPPLEEPAIVPLIAALKAKIAKTEMSDVATVTTQVNMFSQFPPRFSDDHYLTMDMDRLSQTKIHILMYAIYQSGVFAARGIAR